MNTLRIRKELEQLARDERDRQELEAADRRDRIVGTVCFIGLVLFAIDIVWRMFA